MRRWGLLFVCACLAFAAVGGCSKKGTASAGGGKVVCLCFLNDHPCESSRRLEAWTKEALESAYLAELRSGDVVFRSVDYDRPADKHYLKDYALPFQSIVLQDAAVPSRWKRLDKLWELIGDQKAFRQYVQDEVKAFQEK